AELQSQCDSKVQEANRVRARVERKHRDLLEESEGERRRTKKQIAALEEQLKEAREAAFMAQKTSHRARTTDYLATQRRSKHVIPQRRGHSETSLVIREVMVEVRSALPCNKPRS